MDGGMEGREGESEHRNREKKRGRERKDDGKQGRNVNTTKESEGDASGRTVQSGK